MPCVDCGNGVEVCGPDATQQDCDAFGGLLAGAEETCPPGWCWEEECKEGEHHYSIWRPTEGGCRKRAYTKYEDWHKKECKCKKPPE